MIPVRNILEKKGNEVLSVSPDASVFDAMKIMGENSAGSVLVMEEGQVVGIMSERDFTRKIVLPRKFDEELTVRDIMTADVITVTPETSVEECMSIITDKKIRHLPVIDEGQLVGIISIGDVVRYLLSQKEMIIKHYEKYIYEGY
jgi:CBS domain-containing protein